MELGSLIGVTGLLLDILGAWYISRGLVKKNLDEIIEEAPKFIFGINHAYVIGALTQKLEAKIGFFLMFIGFTFQAVTYLLKTELSTLYISIQWIAWDITLLIMVRIASGYIIKRMVNKARKNYLREKIMEHIEASKESKHVEDTKRCLRYLKIKFDENISREDAWARLLEELEINN